MSDGWRRSAFTLAVSVAVALPSVSRANPLPIIYTAFRIGAQSYSLSQLAEVGQSLIGQAVKELDASLQPVTDSINGIVGGVRIPTSTDSSSVVPASVPSSTPTPFLGYQVGTLPYYPTKAAACSSLLASHYPWSDAASEAAGRAVYPRCGAVTMTASDPTCNINVADAGGSGSACPWGGNSSRSYSSQTTCGSGWNVSGSTCSLSNARQAVPDGKQDYQRTGQSFSTYPNDDLADVNAYLSTKTVSVSNDTISVSGMTPVTTAHPVSTPQLITITNTADGGSVITAQVQKTDANGATYTQQTTLTVSPTAVVTSAAVTNQAQTLTANSTGTALTPTTSTGTYAPAASSSPIVFPSDYAKAGEAAAAAATVVAAINAQSAKLDTLHHDLTDSATPPADPTVPESNRFKSAFFSGTFDGLTGWQVPAHTGVCPVATFDYSMFGHGTHIVMDAQCTIAEAQRSTLAVVMAAVWSLVALFVVMSA